jgi:hypothetical protein
VLQEATFEMLYGVGDLRYMRANEIKRSKIVKRHDEIVYNFNGMMPIKLQCIV